jgi:hypothetical protein
MERQTKTLFGTGGLWAVASNVWRQLTRPPTVQEQTIPESVPIEEPNSVPVQATQGTRAIQLPVDGDGAIFHRRYRVKIVDSKFMASALVREVGLRFNQLSPSALAEFEKVLVAIATLGIILDRAIEQHPYLANWSWFGFALFALSGLSFLWGSGRLALTGIVFAVGALNIVLATKSTPSSLSDIGTKLEPSRLVVANVLVFLAATGLVSQGMSVAIIGLLSVELWRLWLHP